MRGPLRGIQRGAAGRLTGESPSQAVALSGSRAALVEMLPQAASFLSVHRLA